MMIPGAIAKDIDAVGRKIMMQNHFGLSMAAILGWHENLFSLTTCKLDDRRFWKNITFFNGVFGIDSEICWLTILIWQESVGFFRAFKWQSSCGTNGGTQALGLLYRINFHATCGSCWLGRCWFFPGGSQWWWVEGRQDLPPWVGSTYPPGLGLPRLQWRDPRKVL